MDIFPVACQSNKRLLVQDWNETSEVWALGLKTAACTYTTSYSHSNLKFPSALLKNTRQCPRSGLHPEPLDPESSALTHWAPRLPHATVLPYYLLTDVSILTLLCSCSSAVQCSFSLIPDCTLLDHRNQRPGKLPHQSCSERKTMSGNMPICLFACFYFCC